MILCHDNCSLLQHFYIKIIYITKGIQLTKDLNKIIFFTKCCQSYTFPLIWALQC